MASGHTLPTAVIPAAFNAAVTAAARGPLGANPRVGAVLMGPTGQTLATGWHRGAGTPHAEADALSRAREAGHDLAGATCVVTLEPCAHDGRTPSCARALIDAGVARVLYALDDPNALAAGGARMLREAGIQALQWADSGVDEAAHWTHQAEKLNHRWLRAVREQRPFVTAKIAHTLDAKVAAADGSSQWITGEAARAEGHALRAIVDAIAVGTGTLKADDPSLTARTPDGSALATQPLRVVLGERDVPPSAAVRGHDGRFVHLPTRDLPGALRRLRIDHDVQHLLIEGGPTLIGAALTADLVDDLWIHQSPSLLGAGTPSVPGLGITSLSARIDLEIVPESIHLAGRDLLFHATPRHP